jgi:hypothetical protein
LFPVADPQLALDLIDIETKDIVKRYKIGLLYVKEGQTVEDDMFSNGRLNCTLMKLTQLVDMSKDLWEFLHFLGEVVDLQGFKHYSGGLDVRCTY